MVVISTVSTPLIFGLDDICRTEADGEKLWLPDDSVYTERKRWKSARLDERTRVHFAMLGHPENVLTPEALLKVRIERCAFTLQASYTQTHLSFVCFLTGTLFVV